MTLGYNKWGKGRSVYGCYNNKEGQHTLAGEAALRLSSTELLSKVCVSGGVGV